MQTAQFVAAKIRRKEPAFAPLPADDHNPLLDVAELDGYGAFRLQVLRLRVFDDLDLGHVRGKGLVHLGHADEGVGGKILDLFQEIAKRPRHDMPPVAFTNRPGRGGFLQAPSDDQCGSAGPEPFTGPPSGMTLPTVLSPPSRGPVAQQDRAAVS